MTLEFSVQIETNGKWKSVYRGADKAEADSTYHSSVAEFGEDAIRILKSGGTKKDGSIAWVMAETPIGIEPEPEPEFDPARTKKENEVIKMRLEGENVPDNGEAVHSHSGYDLLMIGMQFIGILLLLIGSYILTYLIFSLGTAFGGGLGFFFYFIGGLLALGVLFGSVVLWRLLLVFSNLLFGNQSGSSASARRTADSVVGDSSSPAPATRPKITDTKYLVMAGGLTLPLLWFVFSGVARSLPDDWSIVVVAIGAPVLTVVFGVLFIFLITFVFYWGDKEKYKWDING